MKCGEIGFGTYNCAYNIQVPWKCKFPWENEDQRTLKLVSIDKCLLAEVQGLWERGIKTTGCCCGHGDAFAAFIGVAEEHIAEMKSLGYTVRHNSCRSNDEDSFIPKSALVYGEIQKGFNWRDNG